MTRATVWVEANAGGDALVEAVRERLHPQQVGGLPVEVRAFYGRGPVAQRDPGGYDAYHHAEDGSTCIWVDDHWFVPTSAGGDGYACALEHAHVTDCLHDPKTYFFGVEPALGLSSDGGDLDPDRLVYFSIDAFVEQIYVAPWVNLKPPTHAQWKHEPTGATAIVCSPFDVPGDMTDELDDVDCADCLRAIVRIYARKS